MRRNALLWHRPRGLPASRLLRGRLEGLAGAGLSSEQPTGRVFAVPPPVHGGVGRPEPGLNWGVQASGEAAAVSAAVCCEFRPAPPASRCCLLLTFFPPATNLTFHNLSLRMKEVIWILFSLTEEQLSLES